MAACSSPMRHRPGAAAHEIQINGMKYHLMLLFITAGLLCGRAASHASPVFPAQAGYLVFSIEQHPGKSGPVTCLLKDTGYFRVFQEGASTIQGQLPAQEGLRILEEFEKLCSAEGEDRFPPDPRVGDGQRIAPYFFYKNAKGKVLELEGSKKHLPPELVEFMKALWQKLLLQAAQNTSPPVAPAPRQIIQPNLR